MRVYAENEMGRHLFYVEINNCEGDGNFIECSLPQTIFNLHDVRAIARQIFTSEFNTPYMLKQLDQLISLLKTKKELICYYFQPVELKANGRFNIEQANVMIEILLKQNPPNYQVVSIYSNPFIFRIICKELLAYDKSQMKTISSTHPNNPFIENIYITKNNLTNGSLPVEYKVQQIKLQNQTCSLFIKYFGEHPCEFYFHFH